MLRLKMLENPFRLLNFLVHFWYQNPSQFLFSSSYYELTWNIRTQCSSFFYLLLMNVVFLKVKSILFQQFLSLIHNSQKSSHGDLNFCDVWVKRKLPLILNGKKFVWEQAVLLFQKDVPEFMKVVIRFKSQFVCSPRSTTFSRRFHKSELC